ncbi:GNAT family N-acetyltransferase [Salmonirosea aquatica]|uniref:GNAT family N-acetyltransferase n=1 Tax=Salmonirosea aquatica TaxID=2654236 RepID=A0A7C9BEH0_9BACT|nr:GNAT family N-acetyltransferase [Cytophagaceae bacterium SJW1-29]
MMRQPHDPVKSPLEKGVPETYEIKKDTAGFAGLETAFEAYLFQRVEHLATQRPENLISWGLWNTDSRRLVAVFHLDHDGSTAWSLAQAPLGGLQATSDLPADSLVTLVKEVEHWCIAHRIQQLVVKSAPVAYDENQAILLRLVYQRCCFTVRQRHVNHHIMVTSTPFIDGIHPSERRRLRKCLRAGFTVEQWHNPDPDQVYTFLSESRQRQGYPLSLDIAQLRRLLIRLPEQALVFVVKDGIQIISLTVSIWVNSRILYNFCPADNLDYRTYSPMVLLNSFLYKYAQSSGIELIDLGVSLDHLGHEKASLMRFKENLGAEKSEKVTYEKIFI